MRLQAAEKALENDSKSKCTELNASAGVQGQGASNYAPAACLECAGGELRMHTVATEISTATAQCIFTASPSGCSVDSKSNDSFKNKK